LISIIIPTFNRGPFLARAIQSVREQAFQDWELIVVDDGSEDETRAIVEEFQDHRIRHFYQEQRGVSAA